MPDKEVYEAAGALLNALERYQEVLSESLVDPSLGDDARAAIAQAEAAGIKSKGTTDDA